MSVDHNAKPASARERLLDAANELFYEEGVHTVGVDRVVERAGVAKATLYTLFGNKDGLVRAYLVARYERDRERMTRELGTRYKTPREPLLGLYHLHAHTCPYPPSPACPTLAT